MTAKRRTRVEAGIYRRPDGHLEIGYRDAQGRQRWRVVAGGIIAARKALTAAKAERDRGESTADPRLTFNAAADAWIEARVLGLVPNSRVTYGNHLRHLRERFGRFKLSAITPHELMRYLRELERAEVAGWTQRGRLTVVSAIFTYARERLDYPGGNPCSLLSKRERPGVEDQRERRILAQEEVESLLAAADEHHHLLLTTAIQTGARKAEVLGLTWGDIDVQGRTLRIDRQLDRHGHRRPLKTDRSNRIVAMPSGLAAQLAERRLAIAPTPDALVFTRRDGTPYSHPSADRALATALRRAGIEHASWHDLRHTHVSLLFASGRDLVSIAARIGDSIETTLRVYAHEYEAARRRAEESDALDAIYGSAMEASGSNRAQQTVGGVAADLALHRAIRHKAQ